MWAREIAQQGEVHALTVWGPCSVLSITGTSPPPPSSSWHTELGVTPKNLLHVSFPPTKQNITSWRLRSIINLGARCEVFPRLDLRSYFFTGTRHNLHCQFLCSLRVISISSVCMFQVIHVHQASYSPPCPALQEPNTSMTFEKLSLTNKRVLFLTFIRNF